jgi:hypothetical protein
MVLFTGRLYNDLRKGLAGEGFVVHFSLELVVFSLVHINIRTGHQEVANLFWENRNCNRDFRPAAHYQKSLASFRRHNHFHDP